MKEGKDIVDLTASFVAGIVVGSFILHHLRLYWLLASLSLILLSFLLFLTRKLSIRKIFIVHILMALCGIFSITTSKISSSISPSASFSNQSQIVLKTSKLIDNIPYKYENSSALTKAILLGNKENLSTEVKQYFRKSGASHILALSGFHLGIIYLILNEILILFGKSPNVRLLRSIIIIIISGIYVYITGASPSLVRAFLFILINEITNLLMRERNLARTLCTALFIQLVLSPQSIMNIGFQLSYAAMLGIVFIYPIIKNWYPQEDTSQFPIMKKVWNIAALTLSCQIFTAPLTWFYFHSVPKYFLITNLIALPLTTLVMISSITTLVLYAIGLCPIFVIQINDKLIEALIYSLSIISEMK